MDVDLRCLAVRLACRVVCCSQTRLKPSPECKVLFIERFPSTWCPKAVHQVLLLQYDTHFVEVEGRSTPSA